MTHDTHNLVSNPKTGPWHRILSVFAILVMTASAFPSRLTSPAFAKPAAALTSHLKVHVLDAVDSSDIADYKYLINVDNTGNPLQARNDGCSPENPGYPDTCDWPSIRAVPGAAPIYTQGNQDDFNGVVMSGLDDLPPGKYLISVLADGYKMGGMHFSMPMEEPGLLTVKLQPDPLPSGTLRIKVFHDNASTNGQFDTSESGLEGFHAVVSDIAGQVSTDVFGNPLCTTYDSGGEPTGLVLEGCLLSDANGLIAVPNLGPHRYDVTVLPPAGETWLETTTLEGGLSWDSWIQEASTGLDNEFVLAAEPFPWTIFGFVEPMDNLNSGATGGISGTLVAATVFQPPAGALPSYFGDQWAGFSGVKVTGPIEDGWIALSDLQNGDQTVYVGPANPDGTYLIENVPDGSYLFTWWDANLNYILDLNQVTVANGQITNMGTPLLTGWFTRVEGSVFSDDNKNGKRDPGEPGISDYLVVLKDRDNSEIDRMSIAAVTDTDGYYVFEKAYPMGSWMILEAYADRYYTTGVTYQVENQPEETTVLGAGVDVGFLPILGQNGRLDWGVQAYEPGTNGGIVGTVFYDTTRNELDARYQAVEGWTPGIPGVLVTLSKPVYCGTNEGVPCDPTEEFEVAPDGSIAKDLTAGGVACGTNEGEPCDPSGTWELDALENFKVGPVISTAITETWEQPTNCTTYDAHGNVVNQYALPAPGPDVRCLEAPQMGTQFQSDFASLDGNYGFDTVYSGFGTTDEPVGEDIPADDYLVEVVMPEDALGRTMYQVVREEDVNIFGGDEFIPAVPPPACAGPMHIVDVAGVGVDGPDAVDNPSFADAGGSVFEGLPMPYCNVKLVTLNNGKSIAPTFNYFTDVPLPGRWKGYIINDLAISTNPQDLFYGEVAGLPTVPIGVYDFTNTMVASVMSDPNGVYEILLPSTHSVNCPTPSGVCPNVYYIMGNDPNLFGHNPTFRTIGTLFEIYPGLILPSDLAPTQAVSSIIAAQSMYSTPPQCTLDAATPQLFRVSQPYGSTGSGFTITGMGFGTQTGSVTLDGMPLSVASWNDSSISVTVPVGMAVGPHQLSIQAGNGRSTVNGLTFHVVGGPYNPRIFEVGPGRTYATIQDAVNAADTAPGNRPRLVVVYPSATGLYLENVVMHDTMKLQGVGPGGIYPNNARVNGSVIDGRGVTGDDPYAENWRVFVAGLSWSGNQAIFEGPVVYVVADDGEFTNNNPASIDGFAIQGGDQQAFPNQIVPNAGPDVHEISGVQGGGIFVNGYARYLRITNNVLQTNGGAYGGAIRLGTPHLPAPFNDSQNDFVRIANNRVIGNGGTNLAGAIAIYNGTDGYEVSYNDICGNFSAEYGGGISHYGLSSGNIHHNRIYFNRSYDEGGGIMIAGELPADPSTLSTGAGPVNIFSNLIQNNLANDDGGGLRFLMANNFQYNVYNNMIINNVSTHEGGGVALDDAPNVRFYNNTVMNNITTATALTSNGQPAPAGLSTSRNSALLQATLPGGSPIFSNPLLFNNIFWDNRAGWYVGDTVAGIGLAGDPNPVNFWDIGAADGSGSPSPTNSILQTDYGITVSPTNLSSDPSVVSEYDATVRVLPWRGHPRFIDILMVTADATPNLLGDYHIMEISPAVNAGADSKSGVNAPLNDIDGDPRPYQSVYDIGADEITAPKANLHITKTDGLTAVIPGMSYSYTIVAGNIGPASAVGAQVVDTFSSNFTSAAWTCSASIGASCGSAGGSGNINTTVDLDPGSTATFLVSVTLSANPNGPSQDNTATITAPAAVVDPILSNNSATDSDNIDRSYPKTGVLDNFNRGNTAAGLGPNWTGNTASFHITSNLAEVLSAGTALWDPASFGANQEAYFTFRRVANNSTEQALLLKFNDTSATPSIANATSSWVMVAHIRSTNTVQIHTKTAGGPVVVSATLTGISFANGDGMGVRVLDNGAVMVYKRTGANGGWTQIGNVTTTFTGSGRIGVYFGAQSGGNGNRARFDNFGGGSLP